MKKILVLLLALLCCSCMTGCATIAVLAFNAAVDQSEKNSSIAVENEIDAEYPEKSSTEITEENIEEYLEENFGEGTGAAIGSYLENNFDEEQLRSRLEEIYGENYEEEISKYLEENYGENFEAELKKYIKNNYGDQLNTAPDNGAEELPPEEAPAESAASDSTETAQPDVNSLVYTAYETHLQGTDSVGNSYDCIYRIPAFAFETEDAQAANNELMNWLLPYIEEQQTCHEIGASILISELDYSAWIYEDVLTVMVTVHTDWSQSYYKIYSVDAYTGVFLDNADILAKLGITEDMYLEALYYMVESMYDLTGADTVGLEFIEQQLENTLSDENLNSAALFLDENGNPKLHITVYALAGADSYEHILDLPLN